MNTFFINIIFLIITFFILGNTISYGIYEFKTEKNYVGGMCVIAFSVFSVVFSNIVVWIR